MTNSATFLVDDADAPALRNIVLHLSDIGYCETHICKRLGISDLTELLWRALPIYLEERLSARDVLDLSIDLFLLQGTISIDELNQLFDKADQEVLVRVGLLFINEKCVARASIFPVGNRLVFSDHAWPRLPHPGCVNIPYDQVMSVGTDSRWLAHATVRRSVGTALDLCTGSGVHAILAASHSQKVVAVDINPRAAKCTHFNAQASGAANIEIAVGDLFEPVGERHFDLITANPPFVPSPVDSIGFRDGGHSGEDVQRRIVAGLPQHLATGGIAQIVTELGERGDESLSDRLRKWLDGAPMDILILRLRVHSATNYAIGHANGDDSYDTFLNSVRDWASNLKAQGYSHIVSVLLAFQWSDPALGSPLTIIEEAQSPQSNASAEIEAMFFAERLVRQPNFRETLKCSRLCRSGPIGLMEARVLGSELYANTQAKLMGKTLPVLKWLAPVEREILILLEKPMSFSELLTLARESNLDEDTVFKAVSSLVQHGFVLLT